MSFDNQVIVVTGAAKAGGAQTLALILARTRSNLDGSSGPPTAATEAAYYRRCLPVKLKIDLIYQRHRDFGLDLWILWSTVKIVLTRKDERPRRRGRA